MPLGFHRACTATTRLLEKSHRFLDEKLIEQTMRKSGLSREEAEVRVKEEVREATNNNIKMFLGK